MPNSPKTNWIIALVIILILATGIALGLSHKKQPEQASAPASGQNQNSIAATASSSPATTTPATASTGSSVKNVSLAYTDALKTYAYRIQFLDCHGTVGPVGNGTLALKAGDKFMLDNRDATRHVIAFAGQSYTVGGYNFAIASVSKKGTYAVTCDKGGAATLRVE